MGKLAALLCSLSFAAPLQAQTFDAVSVKPHDASATLSVPFNVTPRPDGGVTMINVPVRLIIGVAYGAVEMVNLPGWAVSERYDLNATASLSSATDAQRAAMLKAMLADRFKLSLHVEKREQSAYDLVRARKDGALGPGIAPIATDCAKVVAERSAAQAAAPPSGPAAFPDLKSPSPPCSLRSIDGRTRDRLGDGLGAQGDLLEGEGTIDALINLLRLSTGRLVVDKTGLAGSYRMRMTYDGMSARRGPDVQPPDNAGPSVFGALPDQLGLKLQPSRVAVDALVIDRLERPTEN